MSRRVGVIGLAATGLATARVLAERGDTVTLYDAKPAAALDPQRLAEAAALPGVTLALGTMEIPLTTLDLLVPSPGVPQSHPLLRDAVARGVTVASEIELAYTIAAAPILAITGTNGKTTTTAMLGAICRAAGRETFVAGNIAEDGGKRLPLIAAAAVAPASAVLVAEISSFQLEWVQTFRPRIGAWLNLSVDHLDRYRDLSAYGATKARLFAAQTSTDFAVINADDPAVTRLSTGIGRGIRIPFQGNNPQLDPTLQLRPADLPLPGKHNLANAVAASAMAFSFGLSPDAIRTGLLGFQGVAHRMERVGTRTGVVYINNSMCTNPAAVVASLEAARAIPGVSQVIAIAGGRHKGGVIEPMVRALAQQTRAVVLIGEDGPTLGDALVATGFTATHHARDMDDAVRQAATLAVPGEAVLLVPGFASFDQFTGFEHRGQVFRDAVAALGGVEK